MYNYNIIEYNELDSTNNEAKRLVRAAVEKRDDESQKPNANICALYGAIITARRQTAGRGRRGKAFVSSGEDSIYASFILRPPKAPAEQLITAFAAVAVCKALEQATMYRPSIKWVNDVLVEDKKICGILAESIPHAIILGIGININMGYEDFPPELRGVAGSLRMNAGERTQFFHALAREVFSCVGGLSSDQNGEDGAEMSSGNYGRISMPIAVDAHALLDAYRVRSIMIGRRVCIQREYEKSLASAIGIADDGGLIVSYDDGSTDTLRSGDVSVSLAPH